MPKISVIVPVYKVEEYLKECINSILVQTFSDFELILVDDGSPDNCPIICDDFAENDTRIVVIHKANGGLSSARNAGLNIAKGEYITFIDSDDFVDRNYLSELYRSINGADMSLCYFYKFNDLNPKISIQRSCVLVGNTEYWKLQDEIYGIKDVAHCKLYKANLFKELRFQEGALYEDGLLMYKIIAKCKKIVLCPKCLYFYRIRPGSIMSETNLKDRDNEIDGLQRQLEQTLFYLNDGNNELFIKNYQFSLQLLLRLYFHYPFKSKPSFKKMRKLYKTNVKNGLIIRRPGESFFYFMPMFYLLLYRVRRFFKE